MNKKVVKGYMLASWLAVVALGYISTQVSTSLLIVFIISLVGAGYWTFMFFTVKQ